MSNSTATRGRKRKADESFLNEDDFLINTDITNNNNATAAATNNTTMINDASAAIIQQDDEMKIQDALEAWEEMGDLSRHIAQHVLTNVMGRVFKFRRLVLDDVNNYNNSNDTMVDSVTPGMAVATASIRSKSNRSSRNKNNKAAFFDMIHCANRLQRGIASFCYHHEVLQQELDDLLDKIRSTDNEEDEAFEAVRAPCE